MIRLWLKLMLPLVGAMMAVWFVGTWIYMMDPDLDEDLIQPDYRPFRPHVLSLSGMNLTEVQAQQETLQTLWDMHFTALHLPPPDVTLGPGQFGRICDKGGVFEWKVTQSGQPSIPVVVQVLRSDPYSALTYFYVPLATPQTWVRLEPNRPEEVARMGHLVSSYEGGLDRIVIGFLISVALLIAISLGWYVMLRLKGIRSVLHRIRDGDLSARVGGVGKDLIHELGHDCDAMASQIQQLITQQDTMLRMLAHELRTPLARMDLGIHLTERELGPQQRLATVRQDIEHLERLIQDLTRLIRVEHQVATEAAATVAVREVIADISAGWSERDPDVNLTLDVPPEAQVRGHAALVRVAVINVVRNAQRFARSRIVIQAQREHQTLRLWVDDDGQGVPEADRIRIFQPFMTLGASAGAGHGTGLGLAIVHRIMEASGGSVLCASSPLGGARFELRWPLDASQSSASRRLVAFPTA
jgi:signal transduction histidine kinase